MPTNMLATPPVRSIVPLALLVQPVLTLLLSSISDTIDGNGDFMRLSQGRAS